jgi:hypothetical protein
MARSKCDRASANFPSCDKDEAISIATRFGQDVRVVILVQRARALWCLGYPSAALTDTEHALKDARQVANAATLAYASMSAIVHLSCGRYDTARFLASELITLADEIGSVYWKALGTLALGWVQALRGEAANAVSTITSQLATREREWGGDAGNSRLAHKARPARVRRRICGERHRRLGPSPSYRSGPQGHRKPAANDVLQRWQVSRRVNSSRAPADDPSLVDRVEAT